MKKIKALLASASLMAGGVFVIKLVEGDPVQTQIALVAMSLTTFLCLIQEEK